MSIFVVDEFFEIHLPHQKILEEALGESEVTNMQRSPFSRPR